MALAKALKYSYQYYINPGFGKAKYILPTHVNFPITDNCNSKCQMCNVWKDKSENELTPAEIEKLFSDKLFSNTKHLGISGGEPTLRKDLIECIKSIITSIKDLESLSITTHGFHPTKWNRLLPIIKEMCNEKQINFSLNVSVDGIGDLHEEVRRVENGWKKVLETIKIVKEKGIKLQIQSTISKHNIYGVNEILHYAKQKDIDVVFRKATTIERLYNKDITDEFYTANPENSFFADFLRSESVKSITQNPARKLFYKDLSKRLITNSDRNAPCHFQNNGVLISAHGEMFHCSIDNKMLGDCRKESPYDIYYSKRSAELLDDLVINKCPKCIHDQSGSWNPVTLIKEELSSKLGFLNLIGKTALFGFDNVKNVLSISEKKVVIDSKLSSTKRIHIIGAYGGEHVGDSAILGGVILRLQKRHKSIDEFIVYSKRIDRTKFWVDGLDFEQKSVKIRTLDSNELKHVVAGENDVLVWAGGPIMEMPIDLLEHYTTIKAFKSVKLNFEVVGCGWGPFKTQYSKKMALKVLKSASYVQMRDEYSQLSEVKHEVNRDPAFDYLSQEFKDNDEWSWNTHKSNEFIEKIKEKGFEKLFLLNLRPMWSKYNKSNLSIDELHQIINEKIIEVLEKLPKNIAVVSVPFNTDHYGFSDMEPALDIKDLCDEKGIENYFVFSRELHARDKIKFLKNFDFGLCMRFHACIFLKSLDIPVFGLDYTAGELGKVGGLFESFNDKNYCNILSVEVNKIVDFSKKH